MKWLTLPFLAPTRVLIPIALRAFLGFSFFVMHGLSKVQPGGEWDGGQAWVAKHAKDAPEFLFYIAAWTELLGGLALLMGLLTRWASLGLAGVMAYAVFVVHWKNGFPFVDGGKLVGGYEFAALYGIACVVLAITGPGSLSLDRLFFGRAAVNAD